MKIWTQEMLEKEGYDIKNALITNVDLTTENYGSLDMTITLDGGGWGCVYGGYVLGKGDKSYNLGDIEGSKRGLEYIMYVMNIIGVNSFNDLKGKYVRVATNGWGEVIKIIGNVLTDKWFDAESFFADKENEDAD